MLTSTTCLTHCLTVCLSGEEQLQEEQEDWVPEQDEVRDWREDILDKGQWLQEVEEEESEESGERDEEDEDSEVEEGTKPYWTQPLPSTLPSLTWIPSGFQNQARYGISDGDIPVKLEREMEEFEAWETNGIQLDRGGVYARKVQQSTTSSHSSLMKAFFGFVHTCYKRQMRRLGLSVYQEAEVFMAYISFLKEREVSRGHLLQHIALASKVNAFIKAKATEGDHMQHCNR